MLKAYEIREGAEVFVIPGEYQDTDNEDVHVLTDKIHGRAYEYHGDGEWRVILDDSGFRGDSIIVDERSLIPDTPEYRLGDLVFGKETIEIPEASRHFKREEDRGGRVTTPEINALASLTLAPHTRAVLEIVDPQGLKQADRALDRSGWIEGTVWPEPVLSTREAALKGIGERLLEIGHYLSMWTAISNDPTQHEQYADLRRAGIHDGHIKEFARIAAERCGENRMSMMSVGLSLGLSEVELFEAEEVAAGES